MGPTSTPATGLMAGRQSADQGNQSRVWNSLRQSPAIMAMVPFVLPQVPFPASTVQIKMGQGLLIQVAFVSANTDVTIKHNLGHPVNVIIPCMAPAGTFIPQVKVSSTANSNTSTTLILQSNAAANPTTVAVF